MKRKTKIKIIIILLVPFVVSCYFTAPLLHIAYIHVLHWWSWRGYYDIPTVAQMRNYYENLEEPKLDSNQVINRMKEQKGLFSDDRELIKMVEWYVYHGDKDVIKQLITNLPFEVTVELPSQANNFALKLEYKGKSYSILRNNWDTSVFFYPSDSPYTTGGLLVSVNPVLHEKLQEVALDKETDAHLIYLILKLIESNEPYLTPSSERHEIDKTRKSDFLTDNDWLTEEVCNRNVLSYIKIYVNYHELPIIPGLARARLAWYLNEQEVYFHTSRILRMARKEGIEAAYLQYLHQREQTLSK